MATWEFNWWSWMKLLIESSRSKESWKCSKTMFNKLHVNKWDMCEKADLKESKKKTPHLCLVENLLRSPSWGYPNLNDARLVMCKQVEARRAKTLATCANSPAHPRVRLHPNWCGRCVTRAKLTKGGIVNGAWSKNKVITSHTLKRCFT